MMNTMNETAGAEPLAAGIIELSTIRLTEIYERLAYAVQTLEEARERVFPPIPKAGADVCEKSEEPSCQADHLTAEICRLSELAERINYEAGMLNQNL